MCCSVAHAQCPGRVRKLVKDAVPRAGGEVAVTGAQGSGFSRANVGCTRSALAAVAKHCPVSPVRRFNVQRSRHERPELHQ